MQQEPPAHRRHVPPGVSRRQARPTLTSHATRLTSVSRHVHVPRSRSTCTSHVARWSTVVLASLLAACSTDSASGRPPPLHELEARIPVAAELTLAGTLTRPALPASRRPPVVVLVG